MADERLIMIADDDPDIREVVRILLEGEGFLADGISDSQAL